MTDLGTDVTLVTDLAPVFGVSSGFACLAQDLTHRLDVDYLFYDPAYKCLDLKAYLDQAMTDAEMGALQANIVAVLKDDPRVNAAGAVITRGSLDCALSIVTDDGPFDLVVRPTDLTIQLLTLGVGGGVPAAPAAAPVVVTVKGDKGDPGIQGPEGSGGTGGAGVTLSEVDLRASSLGTEEVIFEWAGIDFSALAASLTARLSAEVLSASGTATFKLRVGGTSGAADGTVVVTTTTGSPAFTRVSASASVASLSGVQYVKITSTSSGAGVDAQARAPTVTFR